MVLSQLLSLLATKHFFVLCFKLASKLLSAALDALYAHLVISVTLFEVTDGHEDRILHLFLPLLDLLEQLWIEHLQSWRTILFVVGNRCSRLLQVEAYGRLDCTTDISIRAGAR